MPAMLHASVVIEWNREFIQAVRADSTSPNTAVRNFAILHVASHDAVNAVTATNATFSAQSPKYPELDPHLMCAHAAHQVAANLYPSRVAIFNSLIRKHIARSSYSSQHLRDAQGLGKAIANRTLSTRKDDRASTTIT